jgi:hypothetical protein
MNFSNSDSRIIVRLPTLVRFSLPELSQYRIVHGLMPPKRFAASSTEKSGSISFLSREKNQLIPSHAIWVCGIIKLHSMPHNLITIPIEIRTLKMEAMWTLIESGAHPKLRGDLLELPQPTAEAWLDGWTIRDRFLRLRRSKSALLKFLRWAGKFPYFRLIEDFEISDFWAWQDIFRKVLVTKNLLWREEFRDFPKISFNRRFPEVQFFFEGKKSKAVIEASCGLYAIGATIELDLVSGAEFKWCARPDCPAKIFKPKSRHQTKYCSYECAHLQSVRNARGTVVTSSEDS